MAQAVRLFQVDQVTALFDYDNLRISNFALHRLGLHCGDQRIF